MAAQREVAAVVTAAVALLARAAKLGRAALVLVVPAVVLAARALARAREPTADKLAGRLGAIR